MRELFAFAFPLGINDPRKGRAHIAFNRRHYRMAFSAAHTANDTGSNTGTGHRLLFSVRLHLGHEPDLRLRLPGLSDRHHNRGRTTLPDYN